MSRAWARVREKTISNCCRHANFVREEPAEACSEEEEDPEDNIPLAALILRVPFEDYTSVDQEVTTSEPVSDIAIVNSIIEARKEDNEERDGDDEDESYQPAVRPSTADMQKPIEVIRTQMEMTENNSDLVPGLQKIERRVAAEE